jgi:hypothetical protein
MRFIAIAAILATACVATNDQVDDLGSFTGGKTDVQEIEIPITIDAAQASAFVLEVDGPFEMVTTYDESVRVQLDASDGAASTFTTAGQKPSLVVDNAAGRHAQYKLVVTNQGSVRLQGLLRIKNPTPTCDPTWSIWFTELLRRLDDASGFIDANERQLIDTLVRNRPCEAKSDAVYARWFTRFGAQLDEATGFIDRNEQEFVDILRSVQPAATGTDAYKQWLPRFTKQVSDASGFIDSNEQQFIDLLVGVRPLATGEMPYVAWAAEFKPFLAAANGFIDSNEEAILKTLVRAKPCAKGPNAEAAWNGLAAIASSNAGAILQAARPTPCQ